MRVATGHRMCCKWAMLQDVWMNKYNGRLVGSLASDGSSRTADWSGKTIPCCRGMRFGRH